MQFSPTFLSEYVEKKLWRFEVLTAVTMDDGISLDVTPCRLVVFLRLGGTYLINFVSEASNQQEKFSLLSGCLVNSSAMKIKQYVPQTY
jgi:hypothetical protein